MSDPKYRRYIEVDDFGNKREVVEEVRVVSSTPVPSWQSAGGVAMGVPAAQFPAQRSGTIYICSPAPAPPPPPQVNYVCRPVTYERPRSPPPTRALFYAPACDRRQDYGAIPMSALMAAMMPAGTSIFGLGSASMELQHKHMTAGPRFPGQIEFRHRF
ncbi:MAG: hypothetical protein Hyperionvirus41_5 [Hyperionvirus sp.]|uniref:Uncharacterized protein n=1 Tax=Hyperionvirus sp. TaxID=2487770 RepID=A0A3G5AC38_9VIRU|nr:MAG: hypothetical protein Hyperionvirus41_5 [Hyperionvirus sp.]